MVQMDNTHLHGSQLKATRWSIPLAIFVILLAFLYVGLGRDPREVPSPLIGKPAPAFTLAQLHEPSQTLSNTDLKGKVWLLNVWASWCVSCRAEHPLLMQLAAAKLLPKFSDQPIRAMAQMLAVVAFSRLHVPAVQQCGSRTNSSRAHACFWSSKGIAASCANST